jgi:hypothetical protein
MADGDAGWRYRQEVLRRTIAGLPEGAPALDREQALTLLDELTTTRKQLEDLRRAVDKARAAQASRLGGDDGGAA